MEINPELIQKFFENKCDPSEWDLVMHYLSHHPGAAEKFFPAAEWDKIVDARPLPEGISAEMRQHIKGKIFPVQTRTGGGLLIAMKRISVAARMGVAAALVILVAGIWLVRHAQLLGHGQSQKNIVRREAPAASSPLASAAPLWTDRINNTDKPLAFRLPDGSDIRLKPHSSFRYPAGYGIQKRDVFLEGEAFFDVAKVAGKPFTVFAGSLQTTVLGTSFRVISTNRKVEVKLYTGKVVVKPAGESGGIGGLPGWKSDIYLTPGEEVSYDKLAAIVSISGSKADRPRAGGINATDAVGETGDLSFNNTSLKEVMDKLSLRYHHKIIYNHQDITGLNFTGTVSASDSLTVVLRLIATMNDLEVQEEGDNYVISKSRK